MEATLTSGTATAAPAKVGKSIVRNPRWSPALLRGCQPLYTQVYPGFCVTLPFPNKPDTGAQSGFTTTGLESYYLPNDCFVSAPFVTAPFVTEPDHLPLRRRQLITCRFITEPLGCRRSAREKTDADVRALESAVAAISPKWGEVATTG